MNEPRALEPRTIGLPLQSPLQERQERQERPERLRILPKAGAQSLGALALLAGGLLVGIVAGLLAVGFVQIIYRSFY